MTEMIENRTHDFLRRKLASTAILHVVLTLFSLSLALPIVSMALNVLKTIEEAGMETC